MKAFDLRSWLTGFALGLSGKPLPLNTGKKLVGYSYNGTVLPKLPEWDREMYPYAVIVKEVFNTVLFAAFANPPATNGTATSPGTIVNPYDASLPLVQSTLSTDGNAWSELKVTQLGTEGQMNLPFWANFDVYYADNTVYLAASDPIPVYE